MLAYHGGCENSWTLLHDGTDHAPDLDARTGAGRVSPGNFFNDVILSGGEASYR
jgi:hypothetical protein